MRLTAALGTPLALGELGWMSTYIIDAIMIGRLPHAALSISASSLGNTIYYALVFCAIRMLTGVRTLVAQAHGQHNPHESRKLLAQALWFVALGTPAVMLATLGTIPLLSLFGIDPAIIRETSHYLHALIWSTAPLLLYMALRFYLQSINKVLLVSASLITATLVNWLFDYLFLYKYPMGIAGSGWATTVVRLYMLVLVATGFYLHERKLSLALLKPDPTRLRALARIGIPDALANITDLGFSTYMSIACARLGATLLAAHQVVLDLDAFVYMIPLGLSYATVVRVGQSAGIDNLPAVRRSAQASLILGLSCIVLAGALFAGLPNLWASVYTNDPAVITAAIPLFLLCAFIQFGDAAEVLYSSALTGLGDTRTPFLANTLLFWGLGAPLSWFLAFHTSLSLQGLWLGRTGAALTTALVMAIAWHRRVRKAQTARPSERLKLLQPLATI